MTIIEENRLTVRDWRVTSVTKCGCPASLGWIRVDLDGFDIVLEVTARGVVWPSGLAPTPERAAEIEPLIKDAWLAAFAAQWLALPPSRSRV